MEDGLIWKTVLMEMDFGVACHKVICDPNGRPADLELVEANPAFLACFGLDANRAVGRRASSYMPDVLQGNPGLLADAAETAISGRSREQTLFSVRLGQQIRLRLLPVEHGYVATVAMPTEQLPQEEETEGPEDFLNIFNLQQIQDEFAQATGVCTVIVDGSGAFVTRPSNAPPLCELYRGTACGEKNCRAFLSGLDSGGRGQPVFKRCPHTGLWDACAPIVVGERPQAALFVCGVRSGALDEAALVRYAGELGLDRERVREAMSASTAVAPGRLDSIASLTGLFANEVSARACQNETLEKLMERLKFAQNHIYFENEQLHITLMSIGDAVITTDKDGRIILMNKTAEKITGYSVKEALGSEVQSIFDVVDPQGDGADGDLVGCALRGEKPPSAEHYATVLSRDGTLHEVAHSVSPIMNAQGRSEGAVIVFRDITEEKLKQKEILYISYHDMLTGLYNRRYFEKKLEEYDEEKYLPLSIVMGDVNSLKMTNDVLGHLEGDNILRYAAAILRASCRGRDIIARWGGDEFVILMPNCPPDEAEKVCGTIHDGFNQCDGFKIKSSISLGIGTKTEPGEKVLEVLKRAEFYMYCNKTHDHEAFEKEMIEGIQDILLSRGTVTREQISRTKELCIKTGIVMRLTGSELEKLSQLADMHDIGNVAVKNGILRKPGRLSEEEWREVRKHPEIGYNISKSSKEFSGISELILARHERWDGKGYPSGLSGYETPLLARILAVVDSYVAMTSDRPHRRAMSSARAIAELRRYAGKRYDDKVVDVFVNKVLAT